MADDSVGTQMFVSNRKQSKSRNKVWQRVSLFSKKNRSAGEPAAASNGARSEVSPILYENEPLSCPSGRDFVGNLQSLETVSEVLEPECSQSHWNDVSCTKEDLSSQESLSSSREDLADCRHKLKKTVQADKGGSLVAGDKMKEGKTVSGLTDKRIIRRRCNSSDDILNTERLTATGTFNDFKCSVLSKTSAASPRALSPECARGTQSPDPNLAKLSEIAREIHASKENLDIFNTNKHFIDKKGSDTACTGKQESYFHSWPKSGQKRKRRVMHSKVARSRQNCNLLSFHHRRSASYPVPGQMAENKRTLKAVSSDVTMLGIPDGQKKNDDPSKQFTGTIHYYKSKVFCKTVSDKITAFEHERKVNFKNWRRVDRCYLYDKHHESECDDNDLSSEIEDIENIPNGCPDDDEVPHGGHMKAVLAEGTCEHIQLSEVHMIDSSNEVNDSHSQLAKPVNIDLHGEFEQIIQCLNQAAIDASYAKERLEKHHSELKNDLGQASATHAEAHLPSSINSNVHKLINATDDSDVDLFEAIDSHDDCLSLSGWKSKQIKAPFFTKEGLEYPDLKGRSDSCNGNEKSTGNFKYFCSAMAGNEHFYSPSVNISHSNSFYPSVSYSTPQRNNDKSLDAPECKLDILPITGCSTSNMEKTDSSLCQMRMDDNIKASSVPCDSTYKLCFSTESQMQDEKKNVSLCDIEYKSTPIRGIEGQTFEKDSNTTTENDSGFSNSTEVDLLSPVESIGVPESNLQGRFMNFAPRSINNSNFGKTKDIANISLSNLSEECYCTEQDYCDTKDGNKVVVDNQKVMRSKEVQLQDFICSTDSEGVSESSDSGVGQIPADIHAEWMPKVSGPLFKKRMKILRQWFAEFNDEQKNLMLKDLVERSDLPQMHMLSVTMEPILHSNCPSNCQDMLAWLPNNVVIYILSFLDPVSLASASQVNRTWCEYAGHGSLWQAFCRYPDMQLSPAREQQQIIKYTLHDDTVLWKKIFKERYCLRRNWLKAKCKVRTFTGHAQGVSCVQFDSKRIVSGSSDKTIQVWDIQSKSNTPVLTLVGHSGTVRCLFLNGNRLVSGSTDRTIKVWDLAVGSDWSSAACRVTMIGHMHTVRCLQVDDQKVVSGSYDKTLKVWDLSTGQCTVTLRGHNAAVLCVQFDDQKIVSGSYDKTIKVWNIKSGECLATLHGHVDAVTCLQFNYRRIISGSLDCTLKFWDLCTGQCIGTIDWIRSEGHTGVVRCLQADSWKIVSAGDDRTLKVWSLETGQRFVTLRNHTDGVTCLHFNDQMIVSGSYDKTVKLWDFSPDDID